MLTLISVHHLSCTVVLFVAALLLRVLMLEYRMSLLSSRDVSPVSLSCRSSRCRYLLFSLCLSVFNLMFSHIDALYVNPFIADPVKALTSRLRTISTLSQQSYRLICTFRRLVYLFLYFFSSFRNWSSGAGKWLGSLTASCSAERRRGCIMDGL